MSKFSLLTLLTPHIWVHMSTVSMVTTTYQVHKSTFIRVTHSQNLYVWSHIHSLLGVTPPQTWDPGSHVHWPQGNPTSQTLYLGLHVKILVDTAHTLHLGSYVHSIQGDYTLPGSQVHIHLGDTLPEPVCVVIYPQSPW